MSVLAVLFLIFVYLPLSVIFSLARDMDGGGPRYRRHHRRRRRRW